MLVIRTARPAPACIIREGPGAGSLIKWIANQAGVLPGFLAKMYCIQNGYFIYNASFSGQLRMPAVAPRTMLAVSNNQLGHHKEAKGNSVRLYHIKAICAATKGLSQNP
jgi:hypothetical protein